MDWPFKAPQTVIHAGTEMSFRLRTLSGATSANICFSPRNKNKSKMASMCLGLLLTIVNPVLIVSLASE